MRKPLALCWMLTMLSCGDVPPGERIEAKSDAVAGTEDSANRFSGVLGVLARKGDLVARCTGALVAPDLMLTARHCVALDDGAAVVCGEPSLGASVGPEDVLVTALPATSDVASDYVQALEIIVAPGGDDTCGFDFAAVRLAQPPPGAEVVYAPRLDESAADGETFTAVGYGSTGSGGVGVRRYRENSLVVCAATSCTLPEVQTSEWLAEDGAFCSADSGSAAIDAEGRLIGTVSRGQNPCSSPILAAMPAWKDWLVEVATQAAAAGSYPLPDWASAQPAPGAEPEPEAQRLKSTCAFSASPASSPDIVSLCALVLLLWRRARVEC